MIAVLRRMRVSRLPVMLYRARLGWLLGPRFLMLTHRGRRTGQWHDVVLEVVHRDPADDVYVVASGWGERAQWLQNVVHYPCVGLTAGTRRVRARAERLDHSRAAITFERYARRHRAAFRVVVRIKLGAWVHDTAYACQLLASCVPLVELRVIDPARRTIPSPVCTRLAVPGITRVV